MGTSDELPLSRRLTDDLYEDSRALTHLGLEQGVMAPEAYYVLGNLKNVASRLGASAEQLSTGLTTGLADETHEAYQDDGSDPAAAVERAVGALVAAAGALHTASEHLAKAQDEIAGQGYR